jgi:hypothetical protein
MILQYDFFNVSFPLGFCWETEGKNVYMSENINYKWKQPLNSYRFLNLLRKTLTKPN